MPQQINLYNANLRRQRIWLSLGNMVALSVVLALVLMGAGALLRAQGKAAQVEGLALDARLQEARGRLAQTSSSAAKNSAEEDLKTIQQTLAARREVLAALEAGAGLRADATVGFADYLRGLARQSVNGLWLTGFSVRQGGESMEIRGRMLVADRLPDYIKRLHAEKVFKGRQFLSLQVERPVEKDPQRAAVLTPYNSFVLTAVQTGADQSRGGAR